jgi:hypothetical protein
MKITFFIVEKFFKNIKNFVLMTYLWIKWDKKFWCFYWSVIWKYFFKKSSTTKSFKFTLDYKIKYFSFKKNIYPSLKCFLKFGSDTGHYSYEEFFFFQFRSKFWSSLQSVKDKINKTRKISQNLKTLKNSGYKSLSIRAILAKLVRTWVHAMRCTSSATLLSAAKKLLP